MPRPTSQRPSPSSVAAITTICSTTERGPRSRRFSTRASRCCVLRSFGRFTSSRWRWRRSQPDSLQYDSSCPAFVPGLTVVGGLEGALARRSAGRTRLGRNEAFALSLLAGELAGPANGRGLLASALLGRLFVVIAELHLAEDAFALHLFLQRPEGLIHIVIANDDLHARHSPFQRVEEFRDWQKPPLAGTKGSESTTALTKEPPIVQRCRVMNSLAGASWCGPSCGRASPRPCRRDAPPRPPRPPTRASARRRRRSDWSSQRRCGVQCRRAASLLSP